MFNIELTPIYLGIFGLITAYMLYKFILGFSAGEGKIVEISDEIHFGFFDIKLSNSSMSAD